MGPKMFGGLNENLASFLNRKLSCAASAKRIVEKYEL